MINVDPNQLQHIRPLTWEEVFDVWRQNEASNPAWIKHYQSKGFSSWEEWRNATHGPINGDEREWYLYRVLNPLESVPTFRGGPFKSWKKMYFEGKDSPRFSELILHPGLQNHDGLEKLIAGFPKATTISGLMAGGNIYTIEGMHRCCAMVLAAQRGLHLTTELSLMLAEYPEPSLPELGTGPKE